jgi:cytidylate kinase
VTAGEAAGREVPVLTVDGPSGSGKGTVSRLVAARLGWHFLDSGALYRVLGLAARERRVALDDEPSLARIALALDLQFTGGADGEEPQVRLDGREVSLALRTEGAGADASRVAALPRVRDALLERQRAFRQPPGLVADGRDMGTVVFPDARAKVFLEASPEERAARRYNQLKRKGLHASLPELLREVAERDARDRGRSVSPLRAADDAVVVDTTSMSIDAVVARVLEVARSAFLEVNL